MRASVTAALALMMTLLVPALALADVDVETRAATATLRTGHSENCVPATHASRCGTDLPPEDELRKRASA